MSRGGAGDGVHRGSAGGDASREGAGDGVRRGSAGGDASRGVAGIVRGRVLRFMHPPRRAIPTRAGLFALGAPIVLGVAAVNASNNLLFILLGGAVMIVE